MKTKKLPTLEEYNKVVDTIKRNNGKYNKKQLFKKINNYECCSCGNMFEDKILDKMKAKNILANRVWCNDCVDKLWKVKKLKRGKIWQTRRTEKAN